MTQFDDLIPTRWSLIQRLKDTGDQTSWKEFFDTYWKLIYGVARKSNLTPEEAQDVVQETVVYAAKKMAEFDADPRRGSFKAWLLTQTRWRIVDQIRKRLPADAAVRPSDGRHFGEDSQTTPLHERIPDAKADQLDALWESEWQSNLISQALASLEPQTKAKHFQVFVMHVIRGHPTEQVAKIARITPEQVYVIKHRLMPLFERAVKRITREPA